MSNSQKNGFEAGSIPTVLHVRPGELAPLVAKWRAQNRRVPWSCLLLDALRRELAPLAGKRYAHLVNDKEAAA